MCVVRAYACLHAMYASVHIYVYRFVHRVTYSLYMSKCDSGCEIGMDTLYIIQQRGLCACAREGGDLFVLEMPKSPTRPAEQVVDR